MPCRHAPRREPRVLALALDSRGIRFAVVDLFEVRATGELKTNRSHVALELRRLLAREKPTAIVATTPRGLRLAQYARLRIPLLQLPPRRRSGRALLALYPEASLFGPTRRMQALLATAITALLYAPKISRRYASRSPSTPPR